MYTWGCRVVAFGLRAFKMDAVVGKNDQAYFSTACWSLEWVSSDKKYWTFWHQVCNSSTCDFCLNQIFSGSSAVRALSDVIVLLVSRRHTGQKQEKRPQACKLIQRWGGTAISPVLTRMLYEYS